jgi:cytochrome c
MSRGKWVNTMRPVIVLSAALGLILATLQLLHAEDLLGSAQSGRRLANYWCTGCHAVEPKTEGILAADFEEIANVPSTTEMSLKVFLRSSHKSMPNFILQPEEADDIVAYILSLRRK